MPENEPTYTVRTRAQYTVPKHGGTRRERHTYRGQTAAQAQWHRDYMKTNAPAGSTRSVRVDRED